MAATPELRTPDAVEVRSGLPTVGSTAFAILLPIVILAAFVLARGGVLLDGPAGLDGSAEHATPSELTAFAAGTIDQALSTGAGIEFEIVQTSTITAREGGPLVEIPDPQDRTKSLGEAQRYVMGTLIERGFMTSAGYWMELIHGPEPGTETTYDLA